MMRTHKIVEDLPFLKYSLCLNLYLTEYLYISLIYVGLVTGLAMHTVVSGVQFSLDVLGRSIHRW